MSMWTYINGSIEVEAPFAACSPNTVKNYVEWVIKDLKRNMTVISGTEGPAIFSVVPYPQETGGTSYGPGYSKACIQVIGYLRDRESSQVCGELNRWLDSFIHYADIKNLCVAVKGDMDADPHVYTDAYCYNRIHLNRREDKERSREMVLNTFKYFSEEVLTPEKVLEIADIFKLASPNAMLTLMQSCELDRRFSVKVSANSKAYLKSIGITVPTVTPKEVNDADRMLCEYCKKRDRRL